MVYTVFYKTSSFAKCCFVVKTVYTKKELVSYFIVNFFVAGKNSNLLIYSFKIKVMAKNPIKQIPLQNQT